MFGKQGVASCNVCNANMMNVVGIHRTAGRVKSASTAGHALEPEAKGFDAICTSILADLTWVSAAKMPSNYREPILLSIVPCQ